MELASPITIYWDLPADPYPSELLQRVCADISECRPLMLQLYSASAAFLPDDALSSILDHFSSQATAVSLTMPGSALVTAPSGYFSNYRLKELLVSADSLNDICSSVKEIELKTGILPGISFKVKDSNWQELPALVQFCRKSGVKRLVLPMQRLHGHDKPFMLTVREQQELGRSLAVTGGLKELSLTIHDPFLWRAFNPDVPFPQAGCQAANTMLAIAENGVVYPCPTLPVSLGSVIEKNLSEIICSADKKAFRLKLLTPPADCVGCEEINVCRGGCRGRGLELQGTLDAIDPACR